MWNSRHLCLCYIAMYNYLIGLDGNVNDLIKLYHLHVAFPINFVSLKINLIDMRKQNFFLLLMSLVVIVLWYTTQ